MAQIVGIKYMKSVFMAITVIPIFACANSHGEGVMPEDDVNGSTTVKRYQHIMYADPTIMLDDGTYYMSGTSQIGSQSSRGFTVLTSTDLKEWGSGTSDTYRFILSPELGTAFGTSGFWAPQWFKHEGKYWLLYTANEQTAIAKADEVTGIFTQEKATAIDTSTKNIDPYLFRDDDGQLYLYHVRFRGGNFIWTAKFDFETGSIDKSTLTQCLSITQPWEKAGNYDNSNIMEGPTVVKWDGIYYLFYSANHFKDPDYAVGYATSKSPTGPWTKYEANPIIRRDIVGEKGSGHGDVFQTKDGNLCYVYHVWGDGDNPDARQTRIVPLIREKGSDGIYKISVDVKNIITPCHVY